MSEVCKAVTSSWTFGVIALLLQNSLLKEGLAFRRLVQTFVFHKAIKEVDERAILFSLT